MKIRPEEHEDLDGDVWYAIEQFWDVIRQRSRASRSVTETTRELLGLSTRLSDIDETYETLFAQYDLPDEIETELETAIEFVEDNDETAARAHLLERFGSACDVKEPDDHVVSETGRWSHCHLHADEHDEEAHVFSQE